MVDWFILFSTILASILLLISGLYFIVYYQHPDDKNEAWLPKLTVLLGFVLSGATVLLLPLDVANNEGYFGCMSHDYSVCRGLNMNLFWNIFYWAIPIWILLLMPFMTFYYEADDGSLMKGNSFTTNKKSRLWEAIKYETVILIVTGILLTLAYHFLNKTSIPVMEYTADTSYNMFFTGKGIHSQISLIPYFHMLIRDENEIIINSMEKIDVPVDISAFFGGFMAFLGWWTFALFGAIGLVSMPFDLIVSFLRRPKLMTTAEMADVQLSIRTRVNELVDIGELLKLEREEKLSTGNKSISRFSKKKKEQQNSLLNFKKEVYLLEEDVDDFMLSTDNYKNYNPLLPFLSLIFGFFSLIISITWIIHIGVFVLPKKPIHSFLNIYFQWFDNWFPLFGVLSVAIFSLYLLLCSVKGCFRFGLRFLFFQIHPMKVGKTYMSSFMFNIGLVLLCALPVVQFCTKAFADYARNTNVYQVMGVQVEYLSIFQWFWVNNIFLFIFVGITLLTILCFVCGPQDLKRNTLDFRDKIKSRRI